jgi:hypothetical protein
MGIAALMAVSAMLGAAIAVFAVALCFAAGEYDTRRSRRSLAGPRIPPCGPAIFHTRF